MFFGDEESQDNIVLPAHTKSQHPAMNQNFTKNSDSTNINSKAPQMPAMPTNKSNQKKNK